MKYEAFYGSDGKHCVLGPGNGMGYYSGTLWPELRCDSEAEAERAAKLCNIAYEAGYAAAQTDIRKAIGAKP